MSVLVLSIVALHLTFLFYEHKGETTIKLQRIVRQYTLHAALYIRVDIPPTANL